MKKTHQQKYKRRNSSEQGMALVAAMMCLLLCTGLGMAVLFNATGEAALSGGFRRNEQAFYAADAGLGITRMALRNALNEAILSNATSVGTSPSYGSRTSGTYTLVTYQRTQLGNILQSSSLLSQDGSPIMNAKSALATRNTALTNAGFTADIQLSLESITDTSEIDVQRVTTNIFNVNVVEDIPSVTASVTGRYRYTITATGNNAVSEGNPNRAIARAVETGVISVTLNATIEKPSASGQFDRAFSQYGTFFHRFNQGSVLAAGTFQGKVHTNDRFRFSSSQPVTFQGAVTQVSSTFDHNSGTYNVSSVSPNSTPKSGLTFNSSYSKVDTLPLPSNVYAQKLAVLNSTGRADVNFPSTDSSDPTAPPDPTVAQMKVLLRSASNAAPPTTGSGSSETINTGVYVPATTVSGTPTLNGGGIYVKGNVDEMTLSKGSNGAQVYAIKQGSTTTTVTITPPTSTSAGTTVITNGTNTTTFQGVPLDRTNPIASEQKPAVALFVDGSISKLHGPAASSGVVPSAIAKDTALTIISTGDITMTGNITYEEPVVNLDGSAVTYANNYVPKNVFGIFTNTGKITWTPNSTYTTSNASMTVDVAMVAFNEAAINAGAGATTGGWTTDCASCNSSTIITLRGSRTVSTGIPNVNSKGQKANRYFDPRFANGNLAPPFFPVTRLNNTVTTSNTRSVFTSTSEVMTQSNTWQRTYN
ncbi:MAG: pilus assembly PilX N-terminal domain-containing protein [Acidobacteria bacterium]|nr:pilus assembly PilX N-terminal domain-containing protein [Acidobacteriota bacterium]